MIILNLIFWSMLLVVIIKIIFGFIPDKFTPNFIIKLAEVYSHKIPYLTKNNRIFFDVVTYSLFIGCITVSVIGFINEIEIIKNYNSALNLLGYAPFWIYTYLYREFIQKHKFNITNDLNKIQWDHNPFYTTPTTPKKEVIINISPKALLVYNEKIEQSNISMSNVDVVFKERKWMKGYTLEKDSEKFQRMLRNRKLNNLLKTKK